MLGVFIPWLVISQAQSPAISFSCRAEPMFRLVTDLSKATGLSLAVSKECAGDVLVISAAGVTTKSLMAEIAKVDAGQWKAEGAIFLFVSDESARQAQARAERVTRAKKLRANIAQLIVETAKQQVEEEKAIAKSKARAEAQAKAAAAGAAKAGDEEQDDGEDAPDTVGAYLSQKRVLQLLQTLDPDDLVLDPGRRIVFSSRPNQMQYALGGDAEQVLGAMIQDHNEAVAKSEQNSSDQGEPDAGDASAAGAAAKPPVGGMDAPADPTMVRIDSYAKADLSVEESGSSGFSSDSIEATVRFYDAKGKVLATAEASVPLGSVRARPEPADDSAPIKPQEPPKGGAAIELSEDSRQLADFGKNAGSGADLGMRVKRIAMILGDPEHKDPLSFFATDSLFSLAKLRQKPLVAVVPDGADTEFLSGRGEKTTVEEFEADLATGDTMTENASGDWIELTPALPESSREYRVDRKALAKYAKTCLAKGSGTLEDVAAFAQEVPSPATNVITMMYLFLYSTDMMLPMMTQTFSWDLIRVFGGFSPDERESLARGNKVPLMLLGSGEQSSVVSMAYGPGAHLLVGNAPDRSGDGMFGGMGDMPDQSDDYKSEPTEVLPSGIPPGGWLEMSAEQAPCFTIGGPGEDLRGFAFTVGLSELASFKAMAELNPRENGANNPVAQVKVGSRTAYHFTFHLADGVRVCGTLNDDHVPKDGQTYSLETLPDDLKAQLELKVAEVKKKMGPIDASPQPTKVGGAPPPR